jgi:tripartite ATP-independent transporter DctM subunit
MQDAVLILAMIIGLVLFFSASGIWLGVAMAVVAISMVVMRGGDWSSLGFLARLQFNSLNSFILTCIPLFTFMANIFLLSGIADKLYDGSSSLVSFLPGGLLHTNVMASALFATFSGSSTAAVATIGLVAIPQELRRGYSKQLVFGSVTAAAGLGPLIPPSLVMIVYGALVGESVGKLFIAGVIPGIILALLFMGMIVVLSTLNRGLNPPRSKFSLRKMVYAISDLWPILVLAFVIMGSIYLGLATPTEAAAMAAALSLIFCALYRRLTWQVIAEAGIGAVKVTCFIGLIFIGSSILSTVLGFWQVPSQLAEIVVTLELKPLVLFAFVCIFYIIMGMFLESFSLVLLTLPVVYPLMMTLGFDSVWFGVVMVLFVELAVITPPVGVNLFVVQGIAGEKELGNIIRGVIPFISCYIVLLTLLAFWPSLALWLPRKMLAF